MSQPSNRPTLYKGYRFPPEIISQCVWLYYRFGVSLRDVSELMLARGIEVSHEAIRLWTLRFGIEYARRLRRTRGAGTDPRARHANLLLLPWPLRVRESDFHPLEGSAQRLAKEPFGFFEFAPLERLDLDLVSRTIAAARDEVDSVDVVLLPESAVDESEVNDLEALLDRHGVPSLITG